ncbi:MAG: outer membrane beta-barrel protein [Deltaproteobacteria bacterium]|nr:outer membrane beta-barrel protein [Deltaproteobacteria bacterium]
MKEDTKSGIAVVLILLFLIGVPADLRAQDFWSKFHPYISVQEEYNSNINLTPTNKKDDWITTVTPGVRFNHNDAFTGLNMDVGGGYNWYATNSDLDYWSVLGNFDGRYSPSRYWNFRLRDTIVRSDEPRERDYLGSYDQYYVSTERQRSIYIRNIVEPSVEYRFGRENALALAYRNTYYDNENPGIEDSMENYVSPRLTYWFDVRNGIILEYGHTDAQFDTTSDWTGHNARGRYTHRFTPHTSVFGEYLYQVRDFDQPSSVDYQTHAPSVGIEHAFSRALTGLLQVGYYLQDPKSGDSQDGATVNANLTYRLEQRTTLSIYAIGGYREEYFTSENLGFVKYYRGGATVSHQLLRRLTLRLGGDVERAEYSADREDWLYGVNAGLDYQILRWLTIGVTGSYRECNSDVDINDYDEYRAIFRITATYM